LVNGHNPEQISVRLWRGYVTALFYARPVDTDVALFASPAFRTLRFPWVRQSDLAERSRAALDVLVDELTADGWQIEEPRAGAAWYELEFIQPPKKTRRAPRRKPAAVSATPRD
jgi:hypothetical protein